jgi:hypothetical protein
MALPRRCLFLCHPFATAGSPDVRTWSLQMPADYDFDDMDPFFRDLGELQAKFMSLEYALRSFLFRDAGLPFMRDLDSISVGDLIDENPFTNRDSLGPLIDKYNAVVRPKDPSLVIDRSVVDLRDALAHGRIYRKSVKSQPRLLKFSKKLDKATGKVRTETVETLDPATLQKWNTYLFMAVDKVQRSP